MFTVFQIRLTKPDRKDRFIDQIENVKDYAALNSVLLFLHMQRIYVRF